MWIGTTATSAGAAIDSQAGGTIGLVNHQREKGGRAVALHGFLCGVFFFWWCGWNCGKGREYCLSSQEKGETKIGGGGVIQFSSITRTSVPCERPDRREKRGCSSRVYCHVPLINAV